MPRPNLGSVKCLYISTFILPCIMFVLLSCAGAPAVFCSPQTHTSFCRDAPSGIYPIIDHWRFHDLFALSCSFHTFHTFHTFPYLSCPWSGAAIILYSTLFMIGVPPAEKRARDALGEAYHLYQRTTSVFFPLPLRHKHISDHKLFDAQYPLEGVTAVDLSGRWHQIAAIAPLWDKFGAESDVWGATVTFDEVRMQLMNEAHETYSSLKQSVPEAPLKASKSGRLFSSVCRRQIGALPQRTYKRPQTQNDLPLNEMPRFMLLMRCVTT